jgi:hypothetical protein
MGIEQMISITVWNDIKFWRILISYNRSGFKVYWISNFDPLTYKPILIWGENNGRGIY